MNKFQDLMDQLNSFETSDAIANFLMEKGIKGDIQDTDSCVITNWFLAETDAVRCRTSEDVITVEDEEYKVWELIPSKIVTAFIKEFDEGLYPDLINDCECEMCMPYYEYGY